MLWVKSLRSSKEGEGREEPVERAEQGGDWVCVPVPGQEGNGAQARFMRTGDSFTVNQLQMCWVGWGGGLGPHSQTAAGPAPPSASHHQGRAGGVNFAASWQNLCHTGSSLSHPRLNARVQLPDTHPSHTAKGCSQGNWQSQQQSGHLGTGPWSTYSQPWSERQSLSVPPSSPMTSLVSWDCHSMPLLPSFSFS